jgi:predicted ATPase/DNA-binding winged helix-turn-helix (wHTH) protein
MPGGDLQIGPYVLSTVRRTLTLDASPVPIGDRAFDILRVLAHRRGEVISKRELLEQVWPETTVEEGALRVQISTLRKTIDPESQVRILNIAGRGYALSVVGGPSIPELNDNSGSHNLPPRRSRLIGRDEVVAELVSSIRVARLLTLVGAGGVGKTTVALAVAEDLLDQFDRVRFVDFSSVSQHDKALLSVVTALQLSNGGHDPVMAIIGHLSRGSTLLVLDNCEHVVEEVSRLVDALLGTAARVRILATSREPLKVASEIVRRIEPLETPPAKTVSTAEEALASPAVQLFAERAAQTGDFLFSDDDAEAVAQICRSVDGLPLAIELVAGWSGVFAPQMLARQLAERPLMGLSGRRTAPDRQRTLEGALDWSYQGLSPGQRQLFACLSSFQSAFSMEQALAVALAPADQAVLDLADLVAKSLVEARHDSAEGSYRLLRLPRAFAETMLRKSGHEDEVRQRHAQTILDSVRSGSDEWWAAPRAEWVVRAARLVGDLQAALTWALGATGSASLAGALAHEAAVVWFRLALPFAGPEYLERALEKLRRTPDAPSELSLRLKIEHTVLEIYVHGAPGQSTTKFAELDDAVSEADDDGIRRLYTWARYLICIYTGQYTAALRFAEAFEQLTAGDPGEAIAALLMRSVSQQGLGQLVSAQEGFEQLVRRLRSGVRRRFRSTPFQYDQLVVSYNHLAKLRWLRGDTEGALGAAREAVRQAEAAHHSVTLAAALLDTLAMVGLLCGDHDLTEAAISRYEAMPVTGELHRDMVEGLWGAMLGQVDAEAAASHILACFEGDGLRDIVRLGPVLGAMCECLGRAGNPESGLLYLDEILGRLDSEPAASIMPELRRARAALLQMQAGDGWREQSDALLDKALTQASSQGSLAWELRIRTQQFRVWAGDDRREKARAALQDVLARIPTSPVTADRMAAERALSEIGAIR